MALVARRVQPPQAVGVANMYDQNENSASTTGKSTEKAGMFAAGGAITTAVLSSACCWLPLLFLAFGASAAGAGTWFEKYRLIFLGWTALMLAGGFYLVYFRAPKCAADGSGACCESTGRGMKRFTKGVLWVSTVVVLAFAAFPNYAGYAIRASNSNTSVDQASLVSLPKVSLEIEGMTCDACAAGLEKSLGKLDGVAQAKVNFESKTADLWLTEEAASQVESETKAMLDTVAEAGFTGKIKEPSG